MKKSTILGGFLAFCGMLYIFSMISSSFELINLPKMALAGCLLIGGCLVIACSLLFGNHSVAKTKPQQAETPDDSSRDFDENNIRIAIAKLENTDVNAVIRNAYRPAVPAAPIKKPASIPVLLKKSDITELYSDEERAIIIAVLKEALSKAPKNTRQYDVLKAVIDTNNDDDDSSIKKKLKAIETSLKKNGADSKEFKEACKISNLKAEDAEDTKKMKLLFANDDRYSVTFSKDIRDKRSKTALINKIRKTFFA